MSEPETNPRRSHLRVAYVWRDEVMADVVALEPRKITLGSAGRTTFVIPDLGLPRRFAVFRHGSRGYVLTLGAGMTGRLSLAGQEQDVAQFIRRGGPGERAKGVEGSFHAVGIVPGDWGVIHLDGRGEHNLFFQFVRSDPPLPSPTWRDSELILPALFFAVILHSVLVLVALKNRGDRHSMTFPGKRELMAEYLVTRPQPPPEPQPRAGEKDATEKVEPAATAGKEGKAGGEGDKPRARAPDPDKGAADELPARVQVGLLSTKSRAELRKVRERGGFDEKLGRALQRIQGPLAAGSSGGHGTGTGLGFGAGIGGTGTSTRGGRGSGGGGSNQGDVQRHGPIDTGGTRAARGSPGGRGVKEVAVTVDAGEPTGELGGLSAEEILKVVRSRKNAIGNCYERALQRQKGLSGKVVLTWRINSSGAVEGARVRSTTLRSGAVEDCIVRQIQSLRFPQPRGGQTANVRNFPFLFAPR